MGILRIVLGICFASVALFAQTAQISGSVRDASGASVPERLAIKVTGKRLRVLHAQ